MNELQTRLQQIRPEPGNPTKPVRITETISVDLYPNSLYSDNGLNYFIGRHDEGKWLWIGPAKADSTAFQGFAGESFRLSSEDVLLRCPLSHDNAVVIRARFDFTRPALIGLDDSFGLGDRLGIANPAHLRAIRNTDLRPVLAQQSIRELQRTQRTPDEVMDAATWAVLQEGYRDGFGADADHLKTTDDIDVMARAGFTMFTFDPGEYVVNEADAYAMAELESRVETLPWQQLQDEPAAFIKRYENQRFHVTNDLQLQPSREQVLRGLVKYGGVIAHTKRLFTYFKSTYPELPGEFELSVDETESVTTPFEHYLVANELKRLEVKLVSLAPRFVGDFEKGIDYRGDLDRFKEEYLKHVKIAEALGPYKISIHSGSDKFSVYKVIGQLGEGRVHVKTAGTSYLEALRTVAVEEPTLFREILDFARAHFEVEKATYHVSGSLNKVPPSEDLADTDLPHLFEQDDARQVLHVTFGKVLTTRTDSGALLFKQRILHGLERHEATHYEHLIQHFHRHLTPFGR